MAHRDRVLLALPYLQYAFGLLALFRNNLVGEHESLQQSLTHFQGFENPFLTGVALLGVACTALLLDDRPAAIRDYTESLLLLEAWRENMLAREAALVVAISGLLLASETEMVSSVPQAAHLWSIIAAIEPRTAGKRVTPPFLSLPVPDGVLRDAAIAKARMLLGNAAFDAAFAAGQALTLGQAVAEALALTAL